MLLLSAASASYAATSQQSLVEHDWLQQAESWRAATAAKLATTRPATNAPAAAIQKELADEYPVELCVKQGRALAADLRAAGAAAETFEHDLAAAAAAYQALPASATAQARKQAYFAVRQAMRKIVLANPLLGFDELLFLKRFTQETYPDICLNHMPWVSRPGGDICRITLDEIRNAHGSESVGVRTLLNGALGPGHVHGMELFWDADRVVFGYAKKKTNEPPAGWLDRGTNYDLRRTVEPTHIFEIDIDGTGVRQITSGEWSDLDPTYAPNGDIVFVSERCGCSLQCNEYDKDETSCNLYVCKPDGSDIRWMSVSKDGDYLPHCFDDGTIGYTRWEYQERNWANIQSIWFIRPDGTGADALFKQHLNDPWATEDARSIPGTQTHKLAAIAAGHHTLAAGPVIVVTPTVGMNDSAGIRIVTPGVNPPEGGMTGTPVDEGGVVDNGGFYMTPYPLSEKCFLVAYTYGKSQNPPKGYGLYLIDAYGNKELIYRDPDISCFTPIPLRKRPRPPILPDRMDRTKDYALCTLSNVTHGVDGIEPGRARYLRVAQRLRWPYDNVLGGQRYTEKAVPNNWTPCRILGDVPLDPDGGAYFRVPVDTAVYFQLLDENRMELRRMRSFISFQPGEVRGCVGCHETRAEAPPVGRMASALMHEPAAMIPPPWGDRPVSFLRDVQPVFDRHCVQCHTGLKPAADLDFSGGLTAHQLCCSPPEGVAGYGANRCFDTLLAKQLVVCSPAGTGDASVTPPLAYGSHKSKLIQVLRNGECGKRAKLSDDELLRLAMWIDANAPYHDSFVNKRPPRMPYDLPRDQELMKELAAVHTQRCAACHDVNKVTRSDWIDIHKPKQSLFLAAPLAKDAGGSGKCKGTVYANAEDADYVKVLKLVESAVQKAWADPRRDLATLDGAPTYAAKRQANAR